MDTLCSLAIFCTLLVDINGELIYVTTYSLTANCDDHLFRFRIRETLINFEDMTTQPKVPR